MDINENLTVQSEAKNIEGLNGKRRKPIRKKRKKAITHIDELNDRGLKRIIAEYSRDLPRKLAIYAYAVITLISFTFMLVTMCSVGYEGFVDGKSLGVAPSKEAIEEIKKELNEEIVLLSGSDEGKIGKITYKFKVVSENHYTPEKEIKAKLAKHSDAVVTGCSIYVDGEKKVTLKSRKDAEAVIEKIKNQYNLEGMECESELINVSAKDLVNEKTSYAKAISVEEAVSILNDIKDSTRDYVVVAGDSLWGIAHAHGINLYDFLDMNPEVGDVIRVGDVLKVPAPKPVVDVRTVVKGAIFEESVKAEMVEVDDPSLYIGQSKITSYGRDGWHKVTADIVLINGKEDVSQRVLIDDEMIAQPVPGKISVGTTPKPTGIGTRKLIWPLTSYTITSRFGPRWGSTHTGLDMAAATGTAVKCCDEGVVIFAGWNRGGYGNLIKVDHKNGMQTWYAHLSKIYVKAGETVAKGEVIGAVGNTGFSTGPHLHLEVRESGVAKNPISYLP